MGLTRKIPNYDEFAVGANHPTDADVQSRAHLIDHDQYGAHTKFGSAQFTNKSGASRVSGDVCILDSANDASFKTTTTAGDPKPVVVVQDSIVNNEKGYVALFGYVADLKVTGAVTRLNWLKTSTTVGLAADAGANRVKGVFAIALAGFAGPGAGTVPALLMPPLGDISVFESGTVMLFKQNAAPTAWTRYVAAGETDSAIIARTNGETPGTGGSWTVSGLTNSATSAGTPSGINAGTAITEAQMPSHTHSFESRGESNANNPGANILTNADASFGQKTTLATGGGATHTHTFTGDALATHGHTISSDAAWRPKFIETIIATKD